MSPKTNTSFHTWKYWWVERLAMWDGSSCGTGCHVGRVVMWDGLSCGTGCRVGRLIVWDGLSCGTGCYVGRVVMWDGLSCGTGCHVGWVVMWDGLLCGMACHVGWLVMCIVIIIWGTLIDHNITSTWEIYIRRYVSTHHTTNIYMQCVYNEWWRHSIKWHSHHLI